MSAPVSAFAVYQSTGSPAKKKPNGKNTKRNGKVNNNKKSKLKSKNNNKLKNNNSNAKHEKPKQAKKKQQQEKRIPTANGGASSVSSSSEKRIAKSKMLRSNNVNDSDGQMPLNSSDEAVFSGEYTLNTSTSDGSCSESDHESVPSHSYATNTTVEEDNEANEQTFSLEALKEFTKQRKAQKRKNQRQQQQQLLQQQQPQEKPSTSTAIKNSPESPLSKTRKMTATSTPNTVAATPKGSASSSHIVQMNSITEGKRMFEWLLQPVGVENFFDKYWEKNVCLIKRHAPTYYAHLISFAAIDEMLVNNHVEFTKNIDITSYKNGVRETLNPEGRAMPAAVWDQYGQGCSVRLLNPQTYLPDVYTLSATLQEYFHCLVGANAYLTPPNSQGFAPHYDDIEAFVVQVEGRKRWKLYKPRCPSEQLPRYSSRNFAQDEIGTPILEEVLEPGDILYFPRGTIHQAFTEPGYHSLHITLSVYQKQSYADLFEKLMPLMLEKAIGHDVDMRRGLPLHTFQHAGLAFSGVDTKERADFVKGVGERLRKFVREASLDELIDSAVDQVAKKYQHEALPPHIFPSERERTIFGSRSSTNERGECLCDYEIVATTNVRLLRANILRLVQEDGDKIRLYYYLDNSMEYCEYEPNYMEIEAAEAASVEILIKSYPAYVSVSQLPLDDDEQKIQVVTALWERGLLMTEKPFKL